MSTRQRNARDLGRIRPVRNVGKPVSDGKNTVIFNDEATMVNRLDVMPLTFVTLTLI